MRPHGLGVRQQLPRQGVVLQARHQQQRLRFASINGVEQRIGCVGGMPRPHRCQAGNGLLVLQGGRGVRLLQIGLHALCPSHALRGRLRSGKGRQLQCGFAHPVGQPRRLLGQARLLQQALRREPIQAGVECQIVFARSKRPQALRPAPAGFELRHQAGRKLLRPLPLRHGHKLCKGQQHHGMRGIDPALLHVLLDAFNDVRPKSRKHTGRQSR